MSSQEPLTLNMPSCTKQSTNTLCPYGPFSSKESIKKKKKSDPNILRAYLKFSSRKLKIHPSSQQRKPSTRQKDNLLNERKYLQMI